MTTSRTAYLFQLTACLLRTTAHAASCYHHDHCLRTHTITTATNSNTTPVHVLDLPPPIPALPPLSFLLTVTATGASAYRYVGTEAEREKTV